MFSCIDRCTSFLLDKLGKLLFDVLKLLGKLFQHIIFLSDFFIYANTLRGLTLGCDFPCCISLMDSRLLLYALPFIAAVIYPITLGKPFITASSPRSSPFLDTLFLVPIVVIFFVVLVLLAPRFIDFLKNSLAVLVKVIHLAALGCPFAALGYAPHSSHDMSVWVSVLFIV